MGIMKKAMIGLYGAAIAGMSMLPLADRQTYPSFDEAMNSYDPVTVQRYIDGKVRTLPGASRYVSKVIFDPTGDKYEAATRPELVKESSTPGFNEKLDNIIKDPAQASYAVGLYFEDLAKTVPSENIIAYMRTEKGRADLIGRMINKFSRPNTATDAITMRNNKNELPGIYIFTKAFEPDDVFYANQNKITYERSENDVLSILHHEYMHAMNLTEGAVIGGVKVSFDDIDPAVEQFVDESMAWSVGMNVLERLEGDKPRSLDYYSTCLEIPSWLEMGKSIDRSKLNDYNIRILDAQLKAFEPVAKKAEQMVNEAYEKYGAYK